MKKSFKSRLGLLTLLCGIMLLASCSKGPELATYIPKDAVFVGNINVKTLWQKGDIDNIDNIAFVKMLRQELRSEDPQVATIVDELIKDPTSSGLYLNQDVVIYTNGNEAAILAGVKNQSKFQDFLTRCADANKQELQIVDCEGYKQAVLDEPISVNYNNDVAILVFNNFLDNNMGDKLMNLKRDESLAGDKNFNQYWKSRKEISFWMDFGTLFDLAETFGGNDILTKTGLPQDYIDAIRKGSASCNLVFDKGAIRFVSELQGINPKIWKDYEGKFNGDIVKYLPEKSYAALSYANNIEYILKIYDNMEDGTKALDETLVDDITIRDLFKALGGSMAFSLFDFVSLDQDGLMPMMALVADIKDASTISQILASLEIGQNDGMYVVPEILGSKTSLYVALNDNALYLTNSQQAAKQFLSGGYKSSLNNVPGKIKSGNYIYADLNISHYPASLTDLIPSNIVQLLAKYTDYTEMGTASKTSAEWVIYLINGKENSLLYTLHFVDDNIVELGNLAESLRDDDEFYVDDEIDLDNDYDDEMEWDDDYDIN